MEHLAFCQWTACQLLHYMLDHAIVAKKTGQDCSCFVGAFLRLMHSNECPPRLPAQTQQGILLVHQTNIFDSWVVHLYPATQNKW
jgi:hypothetical protein